MIESVLRDIPDEFVLAERKPGDVALNRLIDDYKSVCRRYSYLPSCDRVVTGRDLKDALGKINHDILLNMLARYQRNHLSHGTMSMSEVDEGDELLVSRKTKEWLVKYIALTLVVTFCMLSVIVIGFGAIRGEVDANGWANGFMKVFSMFIDIFFGAPVRPAPQ